MYCTSRGCGLVCAAAVSRATLTQALPTGQEERRVSARDSGDSDSLRTDTMRTTTTVTTDYSTLGRLRKNINELDSLIHSLEDSQQPGQVTQKTTVVKETVVPVKVIEKEAPPPAAAPVSPASPKASILKTKKKDEVKIEPMDTAVSIALASAKESKTVTTTTTKRTTESYSGATPQPKVPRGEGSKWTLCGVSVWPLLPSSSHAFFLFSCSTEGLFSIAREVIPCGTSAFLSPASGRVQAPTRQGVTSGYPHLALPLTGLTTLPGAVLMLT